MLYLVNCKVVDCIYGKTVSSEMNLLVEAETEKEAETKIQNHYAQMSDDSEKRGYGRMGVIIRYCNKCII